MNGTTVGTQSTLGITLVVAFSVSIVFIFGVVWGSQKNDIIIDPGVTVTVHWCSEDGKKCFVANHQLHGFLSTAGINKKPKPGQQITRVAEQDRYEILGAR